MDIGGVPVDLGDLSYKDRRVPASGSLHFSLDLPNGARLGRQSLRVVVTRADNGEEFGEEFEARATVRVGSSALLRVTPEQAVLPNQRISVSGIGFSDAGAEAEIDTISIGGHPIDPSRINGGNGPVRLDRGGRWSASIDLPINSATTLAGPRELRVRDKGGREGTALVTFPAREVTITPPWGRPGTTAVIEGKNFPSRNDNGSPFNLLITYDAGGREAVFNAVTNTGGEFATEIRNPHVGGHPLRQHGAGGVRGRQWGQGGDSGNAPRPRSGDCPVAYRRAAGDSGDPGCPGFPAIPAGGLGDGGQHRGNAFAPD